MRAVNRTRNKILVESGTVAATAWTRMRGLLGHRPLRSGEGLLLKGEQAIHTVGMGFPIDILFLDRENKVVHLLRTMPPWRFSKVVWRARNVLELPSGKIEETGTSLSDQIEIQFD